MSFFIKKFECWKCNQFFHKLITTKYYGILCMECYNELYKKYEDTFRYFISALEIEFDTDFCEEFKTLDSITESMYNYWNDCIVANEVSLEVFETCYQKVINFVQEVYQTLKLENDFVVGT